MGEGTVLEVVVVVSEAGNQYFFWLCTEYSVLVLENGSLPLSLSASQPCYFYSLFSTSLRSMPLSQYSLSQYSVLYFSASLKPGVWTFSFPPFTSQLNHGHLTPRTPTRMVPVEPTQSCLRANDNDHQSVDRPGLGRRSENEK